MANEDGNQSEPEILPPEDWEKIPEDLRPKIQAFVTEFEMFRSPLLPPEVMERYGKVVPGLDRKLVEWTEEESGHRRKMELQAFDEVKALRKNAQISGAITALFGIAVAGVVSIMSEGVAGEVTAGVIAIVSVGGPFAARILASRWQNREPSQENQP